MRNPGKQEEVEAPAEPMALVVRTDRAVMEPRDTLSCAHSAPIYARQDNPASDGEVACLTVLRQSGEQSRPYARRAHARLGGQVTMGMNCA